MSPMQQMLLGAGGEPPEVVGQAMLTGEHRSGSSWTVPDGVTSISVVCIGPGAASTIGNSQTTPIGRSGGGGALAYANNIPVTPGATLTYITAVPDETDKTSLKAELSGPASGSQAAWTLTANGGQGSTGGTRSATGNPGSVTSSTPTGGDGGDGSTVFTLVNYQFYPGAGGAGGYGGDGGDGAPGTSCSGWGCVPTPVEGSDGSNGGGGGGGRGWYPGGTASIPARGGGGGGTAPYGQGSNGTGGVSNNYGGTANTTANGATGKGGSYVSGLSGGTPLTNTDQTVATGRFAGDYGGGAGSYATYDPGAAALYYPIPGESCVRIIWPGDSRQFPSTRTANE